MLTLPDVKATPEQLKIISRNRPGIEIIRGSAGSGKTTTAILRLRALIGMFISRKKRQQKDEPVRVLVLTYNRTLRGYIDALIRQYTYKVGDIDLQIDTFAHWARTILGDLPMIDEEKRKSRIKSLGKEIHLPSDFLLDEVEYVMGRFLPEQLDNYLTAQRYGRGTSPRVVRSMRESILNDVIRTYQQWIDKDKLWDWNNLAIFLAKKQQPHCYDIIIADETQDFSANQIRAIKNYLAEEHSLTLVLDTAQRIYSRGFKWQEVNLGTPHIYRLEQNYRNTVEIAQFTAPLIKGILTDDDATMPDFSKCHKHGTKPIVLKGKFGRQISFVVEYLQKINLSRESVAFLHPGGGGWFDETRRKLQQASFNYIEISRQSEWPDGNENIVLSTLHSAKGLEFDHVIIIGLNAETMQHGEEEQDDNLLKFRRLLAMGISRARLSVIIGYKPEEASKLIDYLEPATYQEIEV